MRKILILLLVLCLFSITINSCNNTEKEEMIDSTNTTYDINTTNTTKPIQDTKIKLKKHDTFNGNININNTINNTVLFQKINFTQTVDLNFSMNVLNTSATNSSIEVTFKDCIINSELKDINTPEITSPFETLTEFAENLNSKSFILEIDKNGKILNIKNWTIDEKYTSDSEALNEINKYFSKNSLAMIFEKITYTGPEIINKDNSWDYSFALNNTIPINSECTYNCIDINDYYYVIDVENSEESVAASSKITFPQINGNAKIKDKTKGNMLISKNKGILKRAEFTIDCEANVSDLVLLNLKFPASINLTPLTKISIELDIPLI